MGDEHAQIPFSVAQAAGEYGGLSATDIMAALRAAANEAVRYGTDHFLYIVLFAVLSLLFWSVFLRT